jgi:GNAT superfamily N-acetyltransferase
LLYFQATRVPVDELPDLFRTICWRGDVIRPQIHRDWRQPFRCGGPLQLNRDGLIRIALDGQGVGLFAGLIHIRGTQHSGFKWTLETIRQSCLQVLHGNTPEFFVLKDRDDFSRFLDNLPGPYFVIEDRGLIVACGGWAMDAEEVAALTWGMVRRDLHRQGIGRDLLHYRLKAIRADGRAKVVRLRTVPLVQEFFARQGFDVVDVVPNGYGAGLDRVTMALQLRVAV